MPIAAPRFFGFAANLTETNYRKGDKSAFIRVTTDLGTTWTVVGTSLPAVPLNVVRPAPSVPGRFFVGNDIGVHASNDGGSSWCTLRGGLPNVVVFDLYAHDGTRTPYAATNGRSIYNYDLSQLPPLPAEVAHLSVDKWAGDSAVLS